MERRKIISLQVSTLNYREVLDAIVNLGLTRTSSYVCFANAHMTVEAYYNLAFARLVNAAHIVASDGMPIAKAMQLFYKVKQERVAGMDMMSSIIAECDRKDLSVFFFGSSPEVLQAVRQRINQHHATLRVAGMFAPSFNAFTSTENQDYINIINRSGAQVVLVSLGCPKQEMWMAQHYRQINAVLIGIGGVFAVYGGMRKRAPVWMQRMALEWLHRLWQEPRRMFKRYAVTNTLFIILLVAQWFRLKVIPRLLKMLA